jgi:hypothetical protein
MLSLFPFMIGCLLSGIGLYSLLSMSANEVNYSYPDTTSLMYGGIAFLSAPFGLAITIWTYYNKKSEVEKK